ncbi:MAG: hypothetical protein ACK55Q_01945 [Dolichospermum sp.]
MCGQGTGNREQGTKEELIPNESCMATPRITYYLLPITHYLLPITYYPLPIRTSLYS